MRYAIIYGTDVVNIIDYDTAPSNPPHYLEPDSEREALAAARESMK